MEQYVVAHVIERLDELYDQLLAGKPSGLEGKPAGIVVTGDSDGAQNVIASLANFSNAIGLDVPAFTTLTVLSELHAKSKKTSREELIAFYEKDYTKTADKMVEQLKKAATAVD